MGQFGTAIENKIGDIVEDNLEDLARASLLEFIEDMTTVKYQIKNSDINNKQVTVWVYSSTSDPNKYNFIFDFVSLNITVRTYGEEEVTSIPYKNISEFNAIIFDLISNFLTVKPTKK